LTYWNLLVKKTGNDVVVELGERLTVQVSILPITWSKFKVTA